MLTLKRKVLVCVVVITVLMSCLGMAAFADDDYTSEAVKGTPVIDGVKDSVWDNAKEIVLTNYVAGNAESNATVKAYTMWDEDNLYVLVEVADPIVTNTGTNAWDGDNVELFVDELNEKAEKGMDSNDSQWHITVNNAVSYFIRPNGLPKGGGYDTRTLTTAVNKGTDGYITEIAFPWVEIKGKAEIGTKIGFNLMVDDDSMALGTADGIVRWTKGHANATQWGTITLAAGAVPAPTPVPPSTKPTTPTTPVNPPTGDSSMIILCAAAALAGSGILLGIRKKK